MCMDMVNLPNTHIKCDTVAQSEKCLEEDMYFASASSPDYYGMPVDFWLCCGQWFIHSHRGG